MNDLLGLLFFLGFCLFGGTIVWVMISSDTIVRLEYENHRVEWEKDKEPYGYFWVPPGIARGPFYGLQYYRHILAGRLMLQSLYFSTPDWVRSDTEIFKAVRRCRILALLAIGIWLLVALVFWRFLIS